MTVIMVIASSCHKCDNCLHGGTCAPNGCSCPDPWSGRNCDTSCALGYEGYHCATFSKQKFYGTWDITSNDPLGNSQSYQMVFSNNPAQPTQMYLSNFNNKGYRISCTLTGKYKFDIPQQTSTNGLHASVSGYAIQRGDKLTIYVTEDGSDYFGTATQE
ncbi:MAG: hypothetical protein JWO03_4014 [Bacteroidetes bacterium]|nr:hypothetical protein [Bacteroidota bacterium]